MTELIGRIKINLPPLALKRGRHGFGKVYNSQAKEQKGIRWLIKSQYRGKPLQGAVGVALYFGMPIRNSWSKKKRESMHHRWFIKTPDIDNLIKMYLDCGNKILYDDDCQVTCQNVYQYYDLKPHTILKLYLLDDFFFAGDLLFLT